GKYKSIGELRNLVVSSENGVQVRLGDIADVQDTQKDPEKISRLNQSNAILIQVMKQSDANAVAVSEQVRNTLQEIETDYKSQNVKLKVANDTSDFTLAA